MPNSTFTARPTTLILNSSGYTAQPSGTLPGVTSDNNDGTYAQLNAFPGSGVKYLLLDVDDFSPPALAQIRSITARARARCDSFIGFTFGFSFAGLYAQLDQAFPSGGVTAITGTTRTTRSDGASWDSAGLAGLQFHVEQNGSFADAPSYLYEAYIDIAYNQVPVVSALKVSDGTTDSAMPFTLTTTAQPIIKWTYTDPEADSQERFRVKIYSGTGTVADPDNTAALIDSTEKFTTVASGNVGQYALASALPNGSYRVYVKAADAGSNGRYSTWVTSTFTIQLDSPGTPVIDAYADSALARIGITVQGIDNLLTVNQASLETNTTGWYVHGANTNARSTAQFLNGSASLAMTSTGTGTMAARTADTTSGATVQSTAAPVAAGRMYTALASFRSAAVARQAIVQIDWYTSAGAFITSAQGMRIQTTTTGWTQAYVSGVAPATAAYAVVLVVVYAPAGAGEVHYVDQIDIGPTPVRNMLSADQAGFESGTDLWAAGGNTAIARSTDFAADGAASLKVTATASATLTFFSAGSTNGIVIVPGQTYTATILARSGAVARNFTLFLQWYTTAGAYISGSASASTATTVGGWTLITVTATAPATAGRVLLNPQVSSAVSGEVFYVDRAQLFASSINILTPNQASIETDATGWGAAVNANLARSTAQFLDGAASLSLTSIASGDMSAKTGPTTATPVIPGASYTIDIWFRAATAGRSVRADVDWRDAAGAFLSGTNGTLVTDTTTGWTRATLTATAPAGAVFATPKATVASTGAAAEVHYVDAATIARTEDLTWFSGGRATGSVLLVERSLDNGATWAPIRGAAAATWDALATQTLRLFDYEIARSTPALYRARITATVGTLVVSSATSSSAGPVQHSATGWWLKDPMAPSLNHQIEAMPPFDLTRKKPSQVFDALGRATSVVVTDGVKGVEGTLNVRCQSRARYDKLEAILANGRSLWLEDIYGRRWYISQSGDSSWSFIRALATSAESPLELRFLHEVSIPFVEVAAPTGDVVTAGTPTA